MAVLLFAIYFILLLLITNRIIKKKLPGIGFGKITAAFSFKVFLGCLYGYIFLHTYGGDDTWWFFKDSLPEYQKMIHQPLQFINDFSPASDFSGNSFFQGLKIYLYDVEYWTLRKLLAVFNIFSRGNYYIDALFFDFLVFWGPFLLLKMLLKYFPAKKNILIIILFFFPTTSFWLSGIRGEGLIFLFIMITIYYSAKCFTNHKISYIILSLTGVAGMIVFRGVFLLVFIPAFLSWLLTFRYKRKYFSVFAIVYTLSAIIFFGSSLISKKSNLPAAMASRQQEFFQLRGNTVFKLDSLQPSFLSFLKITPQAFSNTFLRPFVWEAKGILQIVSALDIVVFWVFIFFLFFSPEKNWKVYLTNPILLLFLFYGLSLILLIGYIVPFPGAIVRYKAIPELLLLTLIVIISNYKSLKLKFLLI
ncbi:MAG TPA: hypothetical protein VK787_08575 [Puia sp.]|jgi:hypothetical protein|nr:hypothetical protein [Puia sp.]